MSTLRIGFPAKCRYFGGNRDLGARGRQLWVKNGRLGHGWLRLSHSIPIQAVESIEVAERVIQGRRVSGIEGRRYSKPTDEVFTDISVHTTDSQTALWVVENRDAEWVLKRMSPVLSRQMIRRAL